MKKSLHTASRPAPRRAAMALCLGAAFAGHVLAQDLPQVFVNASLDEPYAPSPSTTAACRASPIALSKSFGAQRALDELDLRIAPGEIFCMLGANGAGKTTTIKLLLGFVAPTSGQALVDGIDVGRDPLLDEPTSGLDPQASAEFHRLLLRQRDAGRRC